MSVSQDAPKKHVARIGCFMVFSHPQVLLSCQAKKAAPVLPLSGTTDMGSDLQQVMRTSKKKVAEWGTGKISGGLFFIMVKSFTILLPSTLLLPYHYQHSEPRLASMFCKLRPQIKLHCKCQSQGHCWWSTIKASASGVVTFERSKISKTPVIKIHQREGGITAQCSRQVLISPALQWSTVVSPCYVKGHLSAAQFSATTNFEVGPRSVTLIILKSIGGLPIFHSPAETCSSWKLRKRGLFSYQQRLPKVRPTSHQR